jgi:hypothetical protein
MTTTTTTDTLELTAANWRQFADANIEPGASFVTINAEELCVGCAGAIVKELAEAGTPVTVDDVEISDNVFWSSPTSLVECAECGYEIHNPFDTLAAELYVSVAGGSDLVAAALISLAQDTLWPGATASEVGDAINDATIYVTDGHCEHGALAEAWLDGSGELDQSSLLACYFDYSKFGRDLALDFVSERVGRYTTVWVRFD